MANQKGGVAKTTSVASLGAAFAEQGKRVLLVDLDAQACLTFSLGVDPDEVESVDQRGAARPGRPSPTCGVACDDGVDLVPSVIDLAGAEAQLLPRPGREYILRTVLEEVRDEYDVILLDCSPSLGVLTLNALTASQAPDHPDALRDAQPPRRRPAARHGRPTCRRSSTRTSWCWGILPDPLRRPQQPRPRGARRRGERYDLPVLDPPIPKTVRFAEAPAVGRSILATSRTSKGAKAYRDVAAALAKKL